MKKTISIILSLLITLGAVAVFGANAVTVKNKTIKAFTSKTFQIGKPSSLKYYCKTENNSNKYINVKFNDNGSSYKVKVYAKKVTSATKPTVHIYYKNSKNKAVYVKSLKYTVTPAPEVSLQDYKINVNMTQKITINNPYAYEYRFKASKKNIVKLPKTCTSNGTKRTYSFKALKKGEVTIGVYLNGAPKKVGEFTIKTGSFKTTVDSRYKTVTLKYNSHGSSTYMSQSHFDFSDALLCKRAGANYYLISDNEDIADVVDETIVYSTGKGTTSATVYEEIGSKSKAVGTVTIKSKPVTMSYVAKQNAAFYDNMIFGHGDNTEYLNLTDTKSVSLKPVIVKRLLKNSLTGSHFSSSNYTITYVSSNKKAATVSSSGKVSAVKAGKAKITFTIKFSDTATYKNSCRIVVE